MYLLDKQDTWSFWANLVYRQNKRNNLASIFSDPHNTIEYSVDTKREFISGVSSENMVSSMSDYQAFINHIGNTLFISSWGFPRNGNSQFLSI